jgi:DNA-binding GntR family transcriptional regulator
MSRMAGRRASQIERAYSSLKTGIVDGRYKPGTPLSEPLLAGELGMSRTPIREGLARLWQEGYLERIVGRGFFVARVSLQSVHDTFDVRRLLEGAAAARAAELANDQELANIAALAEMPAHGTHVRAQAANVRFHLAIAATARNRLAMDLIERCLVQVDRFVALGVDFHPLEDSAGEAHAAIAAAIMRRDAEAARTEMERHLDCGSRLMKHALMEGQLTAVAVR